MSKTPIIKADSIKEFTVRQSKYKTVGKLPTRSLICSPSGGGKTVLLSNLILDIYRDCCSRIFIFSPSIHVDHSWLGVKKYVEKKIKIIRIWQKNSDPDGSRSATLDNGNRGKRSGTLAGIKTFDIIVYNQLKLCKKNRKRRGGEALNILRRAHAETENNQKYYNNFDFGSIGSEKASKQH